MSGWYNPGMSQITVETPINEPVEKVWEAYTNPKHIVKWNFATPDWKCPHAENDLRVGGRFVSRMEAKDGSFGFDFAGTYTKVEPHKLIEYAFGDRKGQVEFVSESDATRVRVTFAM